MSRPSYGIDGTLSYDVSRIEGLDWVCDTCLIPNHGYEEAAEHFGEADDHIIEFTIRDCRSSDKSWDCEMTVREFREFAEHLTGLAKRYDKQTKRVKGKS